MRSLDLSAPEPAWAAQNFSPARLDRVATEGATISAGEVQGIGRVYGDVIGYAESLKILIAQLHTLAQRIPGLTDRFGSLIINAIVLLHRERGAAFDYIAEDAYPSPISA